MRAMPVLLTGLLVWAGLAAAETDEPYPAGESRQVFDGVPFHIRMPADFDPKKSYGLVLVVPGQISDLDAISDRPYVVVNPFPPERGSGLWRASEIKVIVRLIEHLKKVLPIEPANVHAVAVGRTSLHDIFEMLVFRKKTPFVSACYVRSSPNRGSIPPEAKKKMGVLAYDWEAAARDGGGVKKIVEQMQGKVRTVELRYDADELSGAYFKYWLHVMGGGFEPGYDHSFAWDDGAESLDDIKKTMALRNTGGLLYFFSKAADAKSREARALQNEVFFDAGVRDRVGLVVPFKLEREKCTAIFDSFGLKTTPAVVLLDEAGKPVATFEGKLKAKKLARALKKVAPK